MLGIYYFFRVYDKYGALLPCSLPLDKNDVVKIRKFGVFSPKHTETVFESKTHYDINFYDAVKK